MPQHQPLFIDLGAVPDQHCEDCLEDLFKALAQNPAADERAIWAPHDNPWLTDLVEDFTRWGQRALTAIQDGVATAITGTPIGTLQKAEAWERAYDDTRQEIRDRLAAKPSSTWSLDEWMLFCDLLIEDNLPDGVINDMADFLTVRAQLAGKISAAMERSSRPVVGKQISTLIGGLPVNRRGLPPKIVSPLEQAILDTAAQRAAIYIADITADTRKRIKTVVVDGIRATVLGERGAGDQATRQELFDQFAQLNRDWRRIAVTEAGEAHLTGYVAAQRPGTRIKRIEAYRGACDFCRSISGKIFKVVDPNDARRQGATDVWVGKTNKGRSASPRTRIDGALVERSPDRKWWVAAGVQHPHCRGSWTAAPAEPADPQLAPGVDPEFMAWLGAKLN